MKVSVCLASFNGARFVEQQLSSILKQLGDNDELIVVDDCSIDDTRSIVRAQSDPRITLLCSDQQMGHVASFAHAISQASGDIIALSDQDDIWLEGRLNNIRQALQTNVGLLVAGNFNLIDEQGNALPEPSKKLKASDSNKHWRNIAGIFLGARPYYGCAMVFRSELKACVLPIPNFVESHDLWIAMAANLQGKVIHLDAPLLNKRTHDCNVSSAKRRPWPTLIVSRVKFLRCLLTLAWRARKLKINSGR